MTEGEWLKYLQGFNEGGEQAQLKKAENLFWGNSPLSADGFVTTADPSDLKSVWKMLQEMQEQYGSNECVGIG